MDAGDLFNIPEPKAGETLLWLTANPDAPRQLVRRVNKIAKITYKVGPVVGPNPQGFMAVESPDNMAVTIPIQFPVTLKPATAFTGTTLTGVIASHQALQTAYNDLLTQLGNVSINPT